MRLPVGRAGARGGGERAALIEGGEDGEDAVDGKPCTLIGGAPGHVGGQSREGLAQLGVFGMMIPEAYGGYGFSSIGNSGVPFVRSKR